MFRDRKIAANHTPYLYKLDNSGCIIDQNTERINIILTIFYFTKKSTKLPKRFHSGMPGAAVRPGSCSIDASAQAIHQILN